MAQPYAQNHGQEPTSGILSLFCHYVGCFSRACGTSVRLRCLLLCWRSHMWGVKNTEHEKKEVEKKKSRDTCGEGRSRRRLIKATILQWVREPTIRLVSKIIQQKEKSKSFRFTSPCAFLVFSSFQSSFHSTLTVKRITCFNLRLLLGSQRLAWRALRRKIPPGSGSSDGRYGNCTLLAAPHVPVTQFDPPLPTPKRSRVSQDCYNNHNATELGLAFTLDWGLGRWRCVTWLLHGPVPMLTGSLLGLGQGPAWAPWLVLNCATTCALHTLTPSLIRTCVNRPWDRTHDPASPPLLQRKLGKKPRDLKISIPLYWYDHHYKYYYHYHCYCLNLNSNLN